MTELGAPEGGARRFDPQLLPMCSLDGANFLDHAVVPSESGCMTYSWLSLLQIDIQDRHVQVVGRFTLVLILEKHANELTV